MVGGSGIWEFRGDDPQSSKSLPTEEGLGDGFRDIADQSCRALRSRDSPDSDADDNASDYFKAFVDGRMASLTGRRSCICRLQGDD